MSVFFGFTALKDVKQQFTQTSLKFPKIENARWRKKDERKVKADKPAVVLAEDVLDSLRQGEGLAGAVGPNDEDGGQKHGDGRGDSQDSLLLLCIQTRVQLLVPLPEDRAGNGRLLVAEGFGCSFHIRKRAHVLVNPLT